MNQRPFPLMTPIHLKTGPEMPGPSEPIAYVLAGNGLFLARSHSWFGESCVPAPDWPCELERQAPYFIPAFPRVPQNLFQRIVGFFDIISMRGAGEAIVLLVWDRTRRRYRIVVPPQVATIGLTLWNKSYPVGVEYHSPGNLPHDWTVVGDVHSHVNAPAYTSRTDQDDEAHFPGLHIIVGRIEQEPPEIRATAVVDGYRFELPWKQAITGYEKRRWRVPRSWLAKVRVRVVFSSQQGSSHAESPGNDWTPTA